MKLTTTLAFIAITALSSTIATAGSQTGKITAITTRAHDGLIYFTLDGPSANKPACASNSYWMIQNASTETGKKQYAALLAARANDLPVSINGAGTCNTWFDGEDADTIVY